MRIRLTKPHRNLSGLLVLFTFLSLLLTLGAIILCREASHAASVAQARASAEVTLSDAASSFAAVTEDLASGAALTVRQDEVALFCAGDATARFSMKNSVRSLLSGLANFKHAALNASLYTTDGAILSGAPEDVRAFDIAAFIATRVIIRDSALNTPFRGSRLTRVYTGTDGSAYFALLCPVFRTIIAPVDADYLGALVLLCRADSLASAFPPSAERMWLLGADGSVLTSTAGTEVAGAARDGVASGGAELLRATVPNAGWEVCLAYSGALAGAVIRRVDTLCGVIAVVSVLVSIGLLMILRRTIVEPIAQIARQTEQICSTREMVDPPRWNTDELTRLTGGINGMLSRINELNGQMLETRLRSYRERITFLQSRINPHFLYNNLECVRGMAAAGDAAAVREMVSCVAGIYRYGNRPEPTAPLQDEFECARMYARVMALRYGSVYPIELNAEDAALPCALPRMTLQPLIENAIQHGFLDARRASGSVRVAARLDGGALVVTIADDGAGMSADDLARINTPPALDSVPGRHIGVPNVWKRLLLLFDDARSGLAFSAGADGGTTVTLTAYPREGGEPCEGGKLPDAT